MSFTPWAGLVTLVLCPLALVWALSARQWWLAGALACVVATPLNFPFVPLRGPLGYADVVWANWFAAGASVIGQFGAVVRWWRVSIIALLILALCCAALALRDGSPGAWLVPLPVLGAVLAAGVLQSVFRPSR